MWVKLLIIVSAILLEACESDNVEITEFRGIVLSYSTLEPISDIQVIIERNDGVDYGSFYDFIYDTVETNKDGIYSYKISTNDKPYYRIDMVSDNYVTISSSILPDKAIKQNSVNLDTIIIGENAFLKLNLLNNKQDSNDSIFVSINRKLAINGVIVLGPVPSFSPYVLRLYPQYNDTTVLFKLPYDLFKPTIINWSVLDKVEYTEEFAEIDLIPRDTTTFTIEF